MTTENNKKEKEGEIKSKEIDRGVEKAAEEYLVKLRISSASIDRRRDHDRRMGFIAGAKWAGNDADYWKQRCEAAELYIYEYQETENCESSYNKWQELKGVKDS